MSQALLASIFVVLAPPNGEFEVVVRLSQPAPVRFVAGVDAEERSAGRCHRFEGLTASALDAFQVVVGDRARIEGRIKAWPPPGSSLRVAVLSEPLESGAAGHLLDHISALDPHLLVLLGDAVADAIADADADADAVADADGDADGDADAALDADLCAIAPHSSLRPHAIFARVPILRVRAPAAPAVTDAAVETGGPVLSRLLVHPGGGAVAGLAPALRHAVDGHRDASRLGQGDPVLLVLHRRVDREGRSLRSDESSLSPSIFHPADASRGADRTAAGRDQSGSPALGGSPPGGELVAVVAGQARGYRREFSAAPVVLWTGAGGPGHAYGLGPDSPAAGTDAYHWILLDLGGKSEIMTVFGPHGVVLDRVDLASPDGPREASLRLSERGLFLRVGGAILLFLSALLLAGRHVLRAPPRR